MHCIRRFIFTFRPRKLQPQVCEIEIIVMYGSVRSYRKIFSIIIKNRILRKSIIDLCLRSSSATPWTITLSFASASSDASVAVCVDGTLGWNTEHNWWSAHLQCGDSQPRFAWRNCSRSDGSFLTQLGCRRAELMKCFLIWHIIYSR
jgi:hypothetical protein